MKQTIKTHKIINDITINTFNEQLEHNILIIKRLTNTFIIT